MWIKMVVYQNGSIVDTLRIEWPKEQHDLKSFNHKIFYFSKEDWDDDEKMLVQPADVSVLQGFVSESSITKGYIGLVPEWKNGHEASKNGKGVFEKHVIGCTGSKSTIKKEE